MALVSEGVILPPQVDFNVRTKASPKYKFAQINLNNIPSGKTTIGTSSISALEFKLPVLVYNLYRSYISLQMKIPKVASKFTYSHEDVVDFVHAVSYGPATGQNLVDLQWAQNYTKIARKLGTSAEDFIAASDPSCGLYRNNGAVATNFVPGGYDRLSGTTKYVGTDSYIEPKYSVVTPAANTDLVCSRRIPLSAFVGTLFGVDREFYSPVEMYLRIQAGIGDKIGFASDLGIGAAAPATNPVSVGDIEISNVTLFLAVEQNEDLIAGMIQKYESGNLRFTMPFTTAFRSIGGSKGNPTNITIPLAMNYGRRLKSILHTVWNSQERLNTAYDCSNYDGEKIENYRTYMDTKPLQDNVITCRRPSDGVFAQDDWLENKRFLLKSSIMSRGQYSLNWFHKDQFFEPQDKDALIHDYNLDEGLDMKVSRQWQFNSYTPVNGMDNLIRYTYAEFLREVQVGQLGPQML